MQKRQSDGRVLDGHGGDARKEQAEWPFLSLKNVRWLGTGVFFCIAANNKVQDIYNELYRCYPRSSNLASISTERGVRPIIQLRIINEDM